MTTITDLKNVDDMIKFVLSHTRYATKRWELHECGASGETVWYLKQQLHGRSWYSVDLNLSEELGKKLDEVWTKRPAYRRASWNKRTGYLSLPGMLKRLGYDIKNDLLIAKVMEKAELDRNLRNQHRREVRKLALQLLEMTRKYDDIIWPAQLEEMARIQEEEA